MAATDNVDRAMAEKATPDKALYDKTKLHGTTVATKATPEFLYFRLTPRSTAGSNASALVTGRSSAALDLGLANRAGDSRLSVRRATSSLANGNGLLFSPVGKANDPRGFNIRLAPKTGTIALVTPITGFGVDHSANAYGVDAGISYRGFALQGGVSQIAYASNPFATGADLSLSYQAAHWTTALSLGEQTFKPDRQFSLGSLDLRRSYSLEFGGAYRLNNSISLTGGLRYSIDQSLDKSQQTLDPRQNSAVFLGTAIHF